MTTLAALWLLQAGWVTAQADFQFDVHELNRAGVTYTPTSTPPSDWGGTMIITPGAQMTARFIDNQSLVLRYAPLITLPFPGLLDVGPGVLHHLDLTYGVGELKQLRVTAGASLAIGQVDAATSSELLTQFSGFLGPPATGQTADYLGLTAYVGFEKQLGRDWKFKSTETVKKLSSSGGDSSAAFDGSGTATPATSQAQLEEQLSAYSASEAEYIIDPDNSLLFDLQLSDVSFPITTTYLGVMPQVGWSGKLDELTITKVKLGVFKVWSNPFPGVIETPRYLPACDLSFEHTFSDYGMPRLHTRLTAGIGPFYDLGFAELQPRSTLLAEATYDLTPTWQAVVTGRYFTAQYYDLHRWVTILPGRTKEIAILNAGLKYKYSKWLVFEGSVYADQHWYQASVLQPYSYLRELYVLLGATGTWQVN